MRHCCFTLFVVLLSGTTGLAQPAASPPPVGQTPLVSVLKRREKEMSSVQTLKAKCRRTDDSKTFGYREVYYGVAIYMKQTNGNQVAHLALLHLKKETKEEIFERYVYTGKAFYQYVPQVKEIRVYQLPPQQPGQAGDDNFFSLIFGMKAETAQKHYEMTLSDDRTYYYLTIKPRTQKDKAEFAHAHLVLFKDNFLPAQLWFKEPNEDEHTWDILNPKTGVPIDPQEILKPVVPPGWKMVPVKENEAKPQLPRPQQ